MARRSYYKPAMRFLTDHARLRCILFAAACALCAAAAAHAVKLPLKPDSKGAVIRKQIKQLEDQWSAAILSGNSGGIAGLLAENYVGIGPDGNIMNRTEELRARAEGVNHLEKLDVEERKIRVFGTTAVVTSKVQLQGVYSGRQLTGPYRYTRVWSQAHGQWRIVSFEANRVDDPAARKP